MITAWDWLIFTLGVVTGALGMLALWLAHNNGRLDEN